MSAQTLLIGGASGRPVVQLPRMGNRHGLIAGATGTGKTVSLQILAEGFSRLGVPVFAADIKGDLSGLAAAASAHPKIQERVETIPVPDYHAEASPVLLWDLFGQNGHPIRTTVSEMGPLLLANLLELNDTQEGILYAAFRIADDQGLLLLDLKDLRAMLNWLGENRKELSRQYGNLAPGSIAAIQRRLLVLEEQGGEQFFGEPALRLADLMQRDFSGRGVISLLDATRLYSQAPRLYSAFLLWLLAELFEELPEAGDADRPKLVFFFDEAHLLFDRAPRALQEKIEQVVRLIRSKGVGIYFVTQSPTDVPADVLGQLGLKLQHALRAFTPKDRKAIRAAAENFPVNTGLDVAATLTDLGIGEALVSSLDAKGRPQPVERTLIVPPRSRIGPLTAEERQAVLARSPLANRYDDPQDRDSAYEELARRAEARQTEALRRTAAEAQANAGAAQDKPARRSNRQSVGEAFIKSAARSIGSQLGRQLMRGMLGALLGRR
ncbi:helicase HerA-like domain-containing protein [Acidihalobacter ferrooxydans]|uniref:ATP-binding protein n=1 Tax=Acidihalobacter ferrooxydans TaxID=1765967 RepID=A0A1P8UDE9_9GAMM|nr:helicase HerA-like domain-containing protein [Acidihalobacter ferrooxydans]APZ41814.1 ATP-binding protein [Acidihalobacter ferrooxydans]